MERRIVRRTAEIVFGMMAKSSPGGGEREKHDSAEKFIKNRYLFDQLTFPDAFL